MGNIMSYFFPQPAPASIEQVVEVTQDATEEAVEEPVVPEAEDIGVIDNAKPGSLMEEKEVEATQETDEGLEVVEEDKLHDDSNVLPASNDNMHAEFTVTEEASPEPVGAEVKDTRIDAPKDATPEPIRCEASENVDNSVNQEKENIEMIGSINESDVELIEETTDESVDVPTAEPITPCLPVTVVADLEPGAEPIKVPTPEPVKDSTPEPSKAFTPEPVRAVTPEPPRALTPEPVKAPTPEPPRAITQERVKAPTPEPPRALTPEPAKAPTTETPRALTPEPVKAPTPEPPRALTPELVKAPTPEPQTTFIPEHFRAPTPEPSKALTPEPAKAPTPEPPRALTPEAVKAPTPEAPKALTPEPVRDITPEPSKANSPVHDPSLEMIDSSATGIAKESSSETGAIVKVGGPEVEVIGLVEENKVKMDDEEMSVGATGLRDILAASKNEE